MPTHGAQQFSAPSRDCVFPLKHKSFVLFEHKKVSDIVAPGLPHDPRSAPCKRRKSRVGHARTRAVVEKPRTAQFFLASSRCCSRRSLVLPHRKRERALMAFHV